jgi:hypothetical protein
MAGSSGIKCVNPNNWLRVDPAWEGIYMPRESGDGSAEWVEFVMENTLNLSVPEHVRTLFVTAQGAMAYSLLFYPLMALGCDQIMRIVETAARAKSTLMGAPSMRKFSKVIEWLVDNKVIVGDAIERWKIIRELRNDASHPRFQSMYSVGMMKDHLVIGATAINELFPQA